MIAERRAGLSGNMKSPGWQDPCICGTVQGKPLAHDFGPLCLNHGLPCGIVACCFWATQLILFGCTSSGPPRFMGSHGGQEARFKVPDTRVWYRVGLRLSKPLLKTTTFHTRPKLPITRKDNSQGEWQRRLGSHRRRGSASLAVAPFRR